MAHQPAHTNPQFPLLRHLLRRIPITTNLPIHRPQLNRMRRALYRLRTFIINRTYLSPKLIIITIQPALNRTTDQTEDLTMTRRRTIKPDHRLDWRDPNMPVFVATIANGMITHKYINSEERQYHAQMSIAKSISPHYTNDPTYNLRKPRK